MLVGKFGTDRQHLERLLVGWPLHPLAVMEQITYLLFIKRLDDLQLVEEAKAQQLDRPMERHIFPKGKDPRGEPYRNLRWSHFKQLDPREMFRIVDEHVFPFIREKVATDGAMAKHIGKHASAFRRRRCSPKSSISSKGAMNDRDTKGDVYEYMLGKIASAGQNGQFRTPPTSSR